MYEGFHSQKPFDLCKGSVRYSAHVNWRAEWRTKLKKLKMSAYMRKLHPLEDEFGILRVKWRLENALISYEGKHPIVLSYRYLVTNLIISQYHQTIGYLGQEYVVSSLRHFYWMIKGRSAVRRVVRKCFPCRNLALYEESSSWLAYQRRGRCQKNPHLPTRVTTTLGAFSFVKIART